MTSSKILPIADLRSLQRYDRVFKNVADVVGCIMLGGACMNLYEVIFWGAEGYNNDEDTIYLVRAVDWRAAVEHVRRNASPSVHKIHYSTLPHRVHEIGTNSSPFGQPTEQILRGPYFQCAYNHGWRAWDREIVGSNYTNDWKETPISPS